MRRVVDRWYGVVLHLLLVALAVTVVYQIHRNRELQRRLAQGPAQPPSLAVGEVLAPFEAKELDGRPAVVDFAASERGTLLLVFTTTCPACKQNQAAWKELFAKAEARYDVVGVCVDDPELAGDYVRTYELPFRVVVPTDRAAFPRDYKVPGVPYTVFVDADGKVEEAVAGTLPAGFTGHLG